MSDLVGNPEDRFSRVAAHFVTAIHEGSHYCPHSYNVNFTTLKKTAEIEPRREKTGLRGFRPGPT